MTTHTLADCTVPIPLLCMHCDRVLGKTSLLEAYGNYVVVECSKCHNMTPFNWRQHERSRLDVSDRSLVFASHSGLRRTVAETRADARRR